MRWNLVLAWGGADADWIAQLTLRSDCRQHRLRQFIDPRRIIKIHILLILNPTIPMNGRLASLYSIVLFVCIAVVPRTITQVTLIIIRIIIIIRKVILRWIVCQAALIIRHVSFISRYLLTILNILTATIMIQLCATARRRALTLYILMVII